jgi:hypothetical protein
MNFWARRSEVESVEVKYLALCIFLGNAIPVISSNVRPSGTFRVKKQLWIAASLFFSDGYFCGLPRKRDQSSKGHVGFICPISDNHRLLGA